MVEETGELRWLPTCHPTRHHIAGRGIDPGRVEFRLQEKCLLAKCSSS